MNIIKYENVTAEFVEIDAQIADQFLKHNHKNRRIDKNRVAKYVSDMKNGYWCLNGDAIRFDDTGNLIDGQHRLEAIKKSNLKHVFLVIKNVQTESKRTIDTGKSRTGGDILSMFSGVGPRDAGVLSATISKLILYEAGLALGSGGGNAGLITNSIIEEYYKKHYTELQNSLDFINSNIDHHSMILSRSESLFLHIIFSRVDKYEANIFMKKIITGASVEQGSNEYLLRSILTKKAMKTLKIKPQEVLYTAIKAWNRNRNGGCYTTEGNMRYNSRDNGYPFAR